MSIEVLGISGSPVKNSNTDRLVKAVMDAKSKMIFRNLQKKSRKPKR